MVGDEALEALGDDELPLQSPGNEDVLASPGAGLQREASHGFIAFVAAFLAGGCLDVADPAARQVHRRTAKADRGDDVVGNGRGVRGLTSPALSPPLHA